MKIIKTRSGETYYIFGVSFRDPIEDYIEFRQLFKNKRLYGREISYEVQLDVQRSAIILGLAFVALVIIGNLT